MVRKSVNSGVKWETEYGYCRAIRIDNRILVSGTTATGPNGETIGVNDPKTQMEFVINKIERAINQLGGQLEDVVRTRIYISQLDQWEPIAQAHGDRFGRIQPANTLVEARLVGDDYLVEMEAEAIIGAGDAL